MAKYDVNEEENEGGRFASFRKALCSDGKFIGRTPKSWGLILIFYIIYYICLTGFFVGMLAVFLHGMVGNDVPRLTGKQSLLRGAPGVGYAPKFDNDSTLIELDVDENSKLHKNYTTVMKNILRKYPAAGLEPDRCNANLSKKDDDDIDTPCQFDISLLGPCKEPSNSLAKGNPCIFLRMNKIYGYLPDMENSTFTNDPLIKCDGQNTGDKENLKSMSYYPSKVAADGKTYGKISNIFFPYIKQKKYSVPMVALQLTNFTKNVIILMQCQLYGIRDSATPTKFEIIVIDKSKTST